MNWDKETHIDWKGDLDDLKEVCSYCNTNEATHKDMCSKCFEIEHGVFE